MGHSLVWVMRLHHPFSDGAWVRNHALENGSAVGSAAAAQSSAQMCPPIHAIICSVRLQVVYQMKALGRVVVGSAVGGLLGAAAFFAVDGLIPQSAESQMDKQWRQQEGGENECNQRWKNSQYINKPKSTGSLLGYETRYFVNNRNTVWKITNIGDTCNQNAIGSIDLEREMTPPGAGVFYQVKVLLKIEGNKLIKYHEVKYNSNGDNIRRSVLGESRQ